MRTLTLQQGSDAWLTHRRTTRNASEAPAMMGASPHVTRAQLIRQRATGVEPEIDEATQRRFDRGHEVEPALRAMAEKIIGEDLFPVTGVSDDGYLGASLDGVTIAEDTIFEAKQHNAEKRACIARDEIPPADYWQVVHQFAVCESATSCLYLCGDGTESNTSYLWIARERVEADIPKLLAGWAQFDADLAAYVPEPVRAEAVAAPVVGFGALSLRVEGRVLASNLDAFKADAEAFIARLPKPAELQTDQDFADGEAAVKACAEAESRIKAAREAALAQMSDVDTLLRTAADISETIRAARLALEKAVKAEKENRKAAIVTKARRAFDDHVTALKAETKGVWILALSPDFAGAIHGKKSLSSMQDAVDTVLANAKIAANESAAHVRAALACFAEEVGEHRHLFADWQSLMPKPIDDIRVIVRGRIAEHQKREAEKLEAERERIRKEEAERLEREQRQREEADRRAAASPPAPVVATETEAREAIAPAREPAPIAAATPAPRIRLGDIVDAIAPLSITADGLAALGFRPVETRGAAKLYAGEDFPRICAALLEVIRNAPLRAAEKAAA